MNMVTRMSEKGQVVIPKDVRQRLRFAPGDRLDIVERTDGVLLRKARPPSTESFDEITARIRARIGYDGPAVTISEMREAIADLWAGGDPDWDR